MFKKNIFLFASLLIILLGCNKFNLFQNYVTINNHAWHIDSTVQFEVSIDDTIQPYNLLIGVRNGTQYRYSNLYLFVNTIFPNKQIIKDTVEILLDDANGNWLGKKNAMLIDNQILYKKNVLFPTKGNYKFTIQQGMRAELLDEVYNMGLVINKSTK